MTIFSRVQSWKSVPWYSFLLWLVIVAAAAGAGAGRFARDYRGSSRQVLTKPIAEVQVGDRVLAENPTGDIDTRFGNTVDPVSWRRIELSAPKRDGTTASVILLRPLKWLEEQEAAVGESVFISVPECGIDGMAAVLRIDPCPPIRPGKGEVVTGTYRHHVNQILDLRVEGLAHPISTTPNHRFWSASRQDHVRADELRSGERLKGVHGESAVITADFRSTPTDVYNLEIFGLHTYRVTAGGWLVHNADPNPDLALVQEFRGYLQRFRMNLHNRLSGFFPERVIDGTMFGTDSRKALGVAAAEIEGKAPFKLASVSGDFRSPTNLPGAQGGDWFAGRPPEPQLTPGPRGNASTAPTEYDAEYKIFEELMRRTGVNDKGVVRVATDFSRACDSCRDVARQFSEQRKGIRVLLIEANNANDANGGRTARVIEYMDGKQVGEIRTVRVC